MRSLWRILALQWLGGEASESLTGESEILELLMSDEHAARTQVYDVQPAAGISHQAMSRNAEHWPDPEIVVEQERGNR
jgi:hypothetical protein